MKIYRPVNGVYRCINDPGDPHEYVLMERKGSYPVLAPIQDGHEGFSLYPIADFTASASSSIVTTNEGQVTKAHGNFRV